MSRRKVLLSGLLCLVVGLCGPNVIAEDPKLPDDDSQSESFGSIKPYGAEDNKLLEKADDVKVKSKDSRKFSPTALVAYGDVTFVNDLGDPKRLKFKGVSLFSEGELRYALARDLTYQAAARPTATMEDFLDAVNRRLWNGYRHCGCPDARVAANLDGKNHQVVVEVDEGPQFRHGPIEVTGLPDADMQAIVHWLTSPQSPPGWIYLTNGRAIDRWTTKAVRESRGRYGEDAAQDTEDAAQNSTQAQKDDEKETFWEPGKIVDFANFDAVKLNQGIQLALLQVGFTNCNFKIELKRDETARTVTLRISIPKETPTLQVGDIEITGLKRDSREALIKYLRIAEGDRISAEFLRAMGTRLSESCRYWSYVSSVNISETDGVANGKATLRLALEEYAAAPPLGEPLAPKQETMRKCAGWVKSLNSKFAEGDLVCTTEAVELGGGLEKVQFALAADGTLAVRGTMQSTIGIRADHTIFVGRNSIEIYDWKGDSKFATQPDGLPLFQLKVRCDHDADGNQVAATGMGYCLRSCNKRSDRERPCLEFQAEPSALLRLADLPHAKTKSTNGTLTVEDDTFSICISEATGAIQSIKMASFLSAGIAAIEFRSEKGFVAKLRDEAHAASVKVSNSYDVANPWGSVAAFALEQLKKQPALQQTPALATACRHALLALNNHVVREHLARFARNNDDGHPTNDRFWIPPDLAGEKLLGWYGVVFAFAPCTADEMFPRGSWPWTFAREAVFSPQVFGIEDKDAFNKHFGVELVRSLGREDYGPISTLIMSKIFANCGSSSVSANIARKGLLDLSDKELLKDVHLVTQGDHGLAVACRAIAEQCGGLSDEELEEFQIYMPAEAVDALKQLAARRRVKPEEPPGDAIEAVLLECWHGGLKDLVESELRGMSSNLARGADGVVK